MHQLIVLDDQGMKQHVLANNQIIAEFQFLAPIKQMVDAVKNCAPCQKSTKGRAAARGIQDAKRMLGQLTAERKERLRNLMNAQRVRLYYNDAANNRIRVDF